MAEQTAGTVSVDIVANIKPYTDGLEEAQRRAERFNATAQKGTGGLVAATDQVTKAVGKFNVEAKISEKALAGIKDAFGAFQSSIQGSLGLLPQLVGAAGLGGIVLAANSAVQAFGAWEQSQIALEGRLRATQGAIGLTGEQITSLARTISRETLTPIDALQNVAIEMGKTGEITSSVLERALRVLPDLALRVGDFGKASQILTQSLKQPEEALKLLREAGIRFSAEQKELLEGTDSFADRLRNAAEVVSILEQQIGGEGAARGQGVSGAFAQLSMSVSELTVNLGGVIERFFGVSRGARELAQAIEAINKYFFPRDAGEQIAKITKEVDELRAAVTDLERATTGNRAVDYLSRLAGASMALANARERLAAKEGELRAAEQARDLTDANRRLEEEQRRQEEQQQRINDVFKDAENRLKALTGATRAEVRARQALQQVGVDLESAAGKKQLAELTAINQAIENRNRSLAQAGQLTVFERENQRLERQVELFRYGNQEMQIRGQLAEIELRAQQRRQPLTEQQKQQLLEQMRVLQEIKRLTGVVDAAFSSLFNSMADALTEFAVTGKFEFKQFADTVVRQLIRIAMQAFVVQPLLNMVSGFSNPLIASAISSGASGATSSMAVSSVGSFATGGSFELPGGAGPGDKPYLIGLSAGERVDVTPAAGRRRGAGTPGTGVTVINNVNSSKDFEVTSQEREGPDGAMIVEQTFNEVMRRIGRGDGDNTFNARFGMKARTLQR